MNCRSICMHTWMLDFQIWFKSIVGLLAIPIPAKTGLRASNIGVNDGIDHYFKYFIFKFICKVHHWFIPKGSYKCLCKNPLANFGYNCETGRHIFNFLSGAFLNFLNGTAFFNNCTICRYKPECPHIQKRSFFCRS